MQRLQRLLLHRLHPHRLHVVGSSRFQQCRRIGRVGLIALYILAHVVRRQQAHFDSRCLEQARPVMRRATGFHDDQAHLAIGKPALEL